VRRITPGRLVAAANSHVGIVLFNMIAVALLLVPCGRRRMPAAWRAAGGLLLAAGGLLGFRSLEVLAGNYSRRVQIKQDHRLITEGPYARVRHPLYSATFIMYLGAALAFRSVLGLLALPLYIVPRYWLVARYEDDLLADEFGDEYQTWTAGAGRFWPRMRGLRRRVLAPKRLGEGGEGALERVAE